MAFKPQIKQEDGTFKDLPLDATTLSGSTKQQIIDSARENKLDETNERNILYGTGSDGNAYLWNIYKSETLPTSNINGIPKYNYSSGTLSTNTPLVDRDCTNKKYVDDKLAKKQPTGNYAKINSDVRFNLLTGQTLYTESSVYGSGDVFLIGNNDLNVKVGNLDGDLTLKGAYERPKFDNGSGSKEIALLEDVNSSSSGISKSDLLDFVYPVGSVYMSTKNVSPGSFLGGTWTPRLDGRFIRAHQSGYSITGGSNSHTHTYGFKTREYYGAASASAFQILDQGSWAAVNRDTGGTNTTYNNGVYSKSVTKNAIAKEKTANTSYSNNIPVYRMYYMWERTA